LRLVAYQLPLFPIRTLSHRHLFCPCSPADYGPVYENERDKRSGQQWLKAVLGYLEFQTGDRWRRLTDPGQRWHPNRLWYLNGIGTIHDVMAGRLIPENPFTQKKLPRPVRRATPMRRREDRCA
jgi:hypothetical protein